MAQRYRHGFLVGLVSSALVGMGLAPAAYAGPIQTSFLAQAEQRDVRQARVQALLAADALAEQLERFGVDADAVAARIAGLTDAELIQLESQLDKQIAGADVVAVVGTVFIVLLILELVGVTDIFTAI